MVHITFVLLNDGASHSFDQAVNSGSRRNDNKISWLMSFIWLVWFLLDK
jgi:hypothetical protein